MGDNTLPLALTELEVEVVGKLSAAWKMPEEEALRLLFTRALAALYHEFEDDMVAANLPACDSCGATGGELYPCPGCPDVLCETCVVVKGEG